MNKIQYTIATISSLLIAILLIVRIRHTVQYAGYAVYETNWNLMLPIIGFIVIMAIINIFYFKDKK